MITLTRSAQRKSRIPDSDGIGGSPTVVPPMLATQSRLDEETNPHPATSPMLTLSPSVTLPMPTPRL